MSNANADTVNQRMPVLFIPHGAGPCFFMDWQPKNTWDGMATYLKGIAKTLPAQPKAIVMVSAHWLETGFSVTSHTQPELIYDYYGFPPHTYELTYPAPGSPALAARTVQLFREAGVATAMDDKRGFDHGMFIPLKLMFPAADIPVIQLSLQRDLDTKTHLEAGQALAKLRDEGVLIVASGMSFHNMKGFGDEHFSSLSEEFNQWLTAAVSSAPLERDQLLTNWPQAPNANLCHPAGAEEHLLPLMVAAGAAGDSIGRCVYTGQVLKTTVSAYYFG